MTEYTFVIMDTSKSEVKSPHDKSTPAALAYVLFIIPWFFGAQHDAKVRFHINQAFGLFLFGFLLQGILTVVAFWGSLLGIYGLSYALVWIARIIYVFLALLGIKNALGHTQDPLPLIGAYFPSVFK